MRHMSTTASETLLRHWIGGRQDERAADRHGEVTDPEVKAKPKMPADWYQAYQDALKIGRLGLPEIVGVTEYRDIIGVAIQKAIEGAPSAQVLADAQKEFQDMLNKTEG